MNPKRFLTGLVLTVVIQLIFNVGLLYAIPSMRIHTRFILVTIFSMFLFCILLYLLARIVAKGTMMRLYIQLVMVAVFLKMGLCLLLVVVYKEVFEPLDNSFIWSFLFIYITTTIYEVIFLEKVGRQKNNSAA